MVRAPRTAEGKLGLRELGIGQNCVSEAEAGGFQAGGGSGRRAGAQAAAFSPPVPVPSPTVRAVCDFSPVAVVVVVVVVVVGSIVGWLAGWLALIQAPLLAFAHTRIGPY